MRHAKFLFLQVLVGMVLLLGITGVAGATTLSALNNSSDLIANRIQIDLVQSVGGANGMGIGLIRSALQLMLAGDFLTNELQASNSAIIVIIGKGRQLSWVISFTRPASSASAAGAGGTGGASPALTSTASSSVSALEVAVPEASSILYLGSGLLVIGVLVSRYRKQKR